MQLIQPTCSIRPSLRRQPGALAHTLALALALACYAGQAAAAGDGAEAQAAEGMQWTFSGFGTVGAVHSSGKEADFTSSILRADGAGYSNDWSASVDSRLGGQLSVSFDKRFSAVVQVITQQRIMGSYKPTVEWANLKYQVTPNLTLRAGRIALPIFLAADYRKIGYAYPWVRTPVEVYDAIPISSSDGIDASYRWQTGAVKHVTQASYGRTRVGLLDDNVLRAHGMAVLSHSVEQGALSGRVSMMRANVTINIANELFDAFRQFGPAGAAIGQTYELTNKRFSAFTLGATYDPGNWFLMGELGRTDSRAWLGKTQTMYASAGYRFGNLTPYGSFSRVRSLTPTSHPGLPLAGLPPRLAATAAALNAGLNQLLLTIPVQDSVTAGLRWDLRADAALKLQYDRVRPRAGSRGTLIQVQPGFRSDRNVHVASAVLDFVF